MRMRQNSGERAIRRVDNTSTLHSKITWIHTFCKIYVTLRIHHAFLWGCNLYALSQTLRYLPVLGPRPLKSRTSEKYGWTNKNSLCNHAWNSKKLSRVHFQTGNMGNTIFKYASITCSPYLCQHILSNDTIQKSSKFVRGYGVLHSMQKEFDVIAKYFLI